MRLESHYSYQKVLLVNTLVHGGGAEKVARELYRQLSDLGISAHLATAEFTQDQTFQVPNWKERSLMTRKLLELSAFIAGNSDHIRGAGTASRLLQWLAEPVRDTRRRLGHEDFYFPGTEGILDLLPHPVDLVHLHNLHGDYFDLRQLPALSRSVPIAVTLHDQWLMTGHCAYSIDCERWAIGCGECPYLHIYPAIPKDATKGNLQRKKSIYSRSRLYVSAPSQWLLDQIPKSALSSAVVGGPRLIPNGINQAFFNPSGREEARGRLQLPAKSRVVTFAANMALTNTYKDWASLLDALRVTGERCGRPIYAFAIGEPGKRLQLGNVTVQPVPRVDDPMAMADWYRASDLYLQPSRADNHPLTVLEALSCGTPVLATAVGGIPEQIRPLEGLASGTGETVTIDLATGALVPSGDPHVLAECLIELLDAPDRLRRLGDNAAKDSAERFPLDRYVSDTLAWYRDIIKWEAQDPPSHSKSLGERDS